MPQIKPRQLYCGNLELDTQIEKARRAAERDGRLRYIWGYKIHTRPESTGNMLVIGAEDWAAVIDNRWFHKDYTQLDRETP